VRMRRTSMRRLGAIAAMATICGSGTVWAQVSKKSAEENAKKPVTAVVADVSEGDLNGASPISQGLLLDGLIAQWHATADGSNYKLVKDDIDHHMKLDGSLDVSGMDAISTTVSALDAGADDCSRADGRSVPALIFQVCRTWRVLLQRPQFSLENASILRPGSLTTLI